MYLGIDPGKVTGVALVDDKGNLTDYANYTHDQLASFLNELNYLVPEGIKLIVMENYIVYGHMAHKMTGSKMPAVEAIGMVKMWARQQNIRVVMQMASILPLAEKQSGYTPVGAHGNTHWIDALNHVLYYMYKNKLAKTPLAKKLENGSTRQSD